MGNYYTHLDFLKFGAKKNHLVYSAKGHSRGNQYLELSFSLTRTTIILSGDHSDYKLCKIYT